MRSLRRARWVFVLFVLVGCSAGSGSHATSAAPIATSGGLYLFGPIATPVPGYGCHGVQDHAGDPDYADLHEGAPVIIHGPLGEVRGRGAFKLSVYLPAQRACVLQFTVTDISAAPYYTVQFGGHHEQRRISADDLLAGQEWRYTSKSTPGPS